MQKFIHYIALGLILSIMPNLSGIAQQKVVPPSEKGSSCQLKLSSIYFNPLGFVQFGPVIGAEFLIHPGIYGDVHFRYTALGLLYRSIESENKTARVSFGSAAFGVGGKYFLPNFLSSDQFYVGGVTDFGWGSTRSKDSYLDWKGKNFYIDVMGNFGYRKSCSSGLLLSMSLFAGLSPTLKHTWWYVSEPDNIFKEPHKVAFIGMLEFSIGWAPK